MPLKPDFLREAARWIATDTVTDRSNGGLIDRAERLLRGLGFSVRRQMIVERGVPFFNLLARRGPAAGRPLLLNTHTDTVPPGPAGLWTATQGNPFRLTRKGGFLHGLGVADVKLNLLCQIEALRRLGPVVFQKPVVVAGTYGEERGLTGARRLIAGWRGAKPALVVVGEPTEMALIHRHRGYLVFDWQLPPGPPVTAGTAWRAAFQGKSAHSSTPRLGVNALDHGLDFLRRLGPGVHVVAAAGGTAHNQVPAEAVFTFTGPVAAPRAVAAGIQLTRTALRGPTRTLPWALLSRLGGISRALPRTHSLNFGVLTQGTDGWQARFDLRFPPEDDAARLVRQVFHALRGVGRVSVRLSDPALDSPRRGPAVTFLTRALRGAGLPATLMVKQTCTEAGLYHAWGAPAVVVGPGRSVGNIHRPNERIALSQLDAAVRFTEELLRQWTTTP